MTLLHGNILKENLFNNPGWRWLCKSVWLATVTSVDPLDLLDVIHVFITGNGILVREFFLRLTHKFEAPKFPGSLLRN